MFLLPLDPPAIAAAMLCIERGRVPVPLPARPEKVPAGPGRGLPVLLPAQAAGVPDTQLRLFPTEGYIFVAGSVTPEQLIQALQPLLLPWPGVAETGLVRPDVLSAGQAGPADPLERRFRFPLTAGCASKCGTFLWQVDVFARLRKAGANIAPMAHMAGILVVEGGPAGLLGRYEPRLEHPPRALLAPGGMIARGRDTAQRLKKLALLLKQGAVRFCGLRGSNNVSRLPVYALPGTPIEPVGHIENTKCFSCGGPLWGNCGHMQAVPTLPIVALVCPICRKGIAMQGSRYTHRLVDLPTHIAESGAVVARRLLDEPDDSFVWVLREPPLVAVGDTVLMLRAPNKAFFEGALPFLRDHPRREHLRLVPVRQIIVCG